MGKARAARAARKPKSQWDRLRGRICALYEHHTLQDVIAMLRDQDKFVVSKRQLVYRLNKWDCKKYNTGDGEDGETPESDDNASSPDSISYDCDVLSACNEAECATHHTIPNEVIGGQGQVSWDVQMANAQFTAGDHKSAWETYKLNPQGLQNLTALARSAETKEQCNDTLGLLKQHIYSLDRTEQLYCSLLYILVCDTTGHPLEKGISDGVGIAASRILDPEAGFLLRRDGSIDVVAYALLDSFNENHNQLLPQKADEGRLEALLYDFDERVQDRTDGALRQCAQWCHQQLFYISSHLEDTKRPNLRVVPGDFQGLWKDHLEIFGTLWNILATQHTANGGGGGVWPAWANRAVEDLNLSHAELLSCVCWVVVEAADKLRIQDRRQGERDPVMTLFVSARMAAHAVSHRPAAVLWTAFREAFMRFHRPIVAVNDENTRFNHLAMEEFGAFIQGTFVGLDGGDEDWIPFMQRLFPFDASLGS